MEMTSSPADLMLMVVIGILAMKNSFVVVIYLVFLGCK